jgi:hypothetical protein
MSYWSRDKPHGDVPAVRIAQSDALAGNRSLPINDNATMAATSASVSAPQAIKVRRSVTRVFVIA